MLSKNQFFELNLLYGLDERIAETIPNLMLESGRMVNTFGWNPLTFAFVLGHEHVLEYV